MQRHIHFVLVCNQGYPNDQTHWSSKNNLKLEVDLHELCTDTFKRTTKVLSQVRITHKGCGHYSTILPFHLLKGEGLPSIFLQRIKVHCQHVLCMDWVLVNKLKWIKIWEENVKFSTLIIEVPRIDFWQINYQFGTSAPGMLIEYNKGLALLSPCHSSMFVAIQLIKFHTKRIIRKTYLPPPPHIKRKKKKKKKMEIFGLGGGIVGW